MDNVALCQACGVQKASGPKTIRGSSGRHGGSGCPRQVAADALGGEHRTAAGRRFFFLLFLLLVFSCIL